MKKEYIIKEIIDWVVCFIIAVVIALFIKYFFVTPTIVQQTSMYPTLVHNERLVLNRFIRLSKKVPERGQIITFEAPNGIESISNQNPTANYSNEPKGIFSKFFYYVLELGKQSYIKRVIGLPGDEVILKDGEVYINGQKLNEEYLQEGVQTFKQNDNLTNFIVPENTVFVMGDNRGNSVDSRTFGCIPIKKIEGKVVIRFWPLNKFGKV